ncbi:MAG TPA: hypothetical protein VK610_02695, partial [Rhodothermales bacterium]|nr:hypothetical protein [Rhodothermales bacterium]
MRTPYLLACLAAVGTLAFTAVRPAAAQIDITALNCATSATTNGHIAWPAGDPIWEMDVVRPSRSSGLDGSGLEILNVRYRGRLVLKRGHVPILNVEYVGAGCSCFRDWSDSETGYCVTPRTGSGASAVCTGATPSSCIYNASPGNVYTTCERNEEGAAGGNPGQFTGIAVEDFGDEMVMTGNMQAGWYRYRMKWHFYADGRIWPEYSYSAASASCTNQTHRHHAYWRLDFDIDGTPNNDVIAEVNPTTSTTTTFTNEVQRTWGTASDGVYWTVRDGDTNAGFDIVPSAVDRMLPIDSFSKLDAMAVRYVAGNYDDGSPSCPISPNVTQLANNETLANQDVVFWYRSSALHVGGDPWECDIVGPSLNPQNFVTTGSEEEGGPEAPADGLVLESARPNPFNPTTSIRFRTAEAQYVTVKLYDVTGREVAVLFEGYARENR